MLALQDPGRSIKYHRRSPSLIAGAEYMGVFIISHPVCTHLGGPVRKPPTTSWGSAGDCRAQIWGLPWLQGGVFPASVSQWRQGGLPHPRPASDCSPQPPLLAEVRFPGPRPNCKGLPTHFYHLCPCREGMSWGTGFPNASCALSLESQPPLWGQVWGNPVHFLPLASPRGAQLACGERQEMRE